MNRVNYRLSHFLLAAILGMLIAASAGHLSGASFRNGTATCPSSGAQPLSSTSISASWLVVQSPSAPVSNTGRIHFGGSGVTTSTANYINPGDAYNFPTAGNANVYNLGQIYFACTVNTDIVTYSYLQ